MNQRRNGKNISSTLSTETERQIQNLQAYARNHAEFLEGESLQHIDRRFAAGNFFLSGANVNVGNALQIRFRSTQRKPQIPLVFS